MSVVRQLLQIAAVESFRNATIAGADVFDSRIDTLPDLLANAKRPVLIVSIEASEQPVGGQGQRNFLGRDTRLTMLVQAAVASGVEIRDDAGDVVIAEIGETDSAFESRLNVLDRQWRSILQAGDGTWPAIWRGLVNAVGKIKDTRAVDPETGRKHAARFTEIEIDVVWEPDVGAPLPPCIEAGLAAMEQDGDASYAELARAFRDALAPPETWEGWQAVQSGLFLSNDKLLALGLGPLAQDEDRSTPALTEAVIAQAGVEDVTVGGA